MGFDDIKKIDLEAVKAFEFEGTPMSGRAAALDAWLRAQEAAFAAECVYSEIVLAELSGDTM